jgi:iron(III) transport system substrate-binding protein
VEETVMKFTRVAMLATIALATAFAGEAGAVSNSDAVNKRVAELYEAAKKEGEVIWYTTTREAYTKKMSVFWKEKFPEVKLTILRKQSPQLVQTIEAEIAAGKPRADILTSALGYTGIEFKAKGYYLPYKPVNFDRIDARFKDPDGYWIAQHMTLLLGAYNTKAVDKKDLPRKYADLLHPKWKGKLLSAHPSTSGSHSGFYGGIVNEKINGGWDFLKQLKDQDVMFVRGNAEAARMIVAGERAIGITISSSNLFVARSKGQPIDVFTYEDGVIVNNPPKGILKFTKRPNAAKLFIEWIFSEEGQTQLSEWGEYWPVLAGIPGPEGAPDLTKVKLIAPDLTDQVSDTGRDSFIKKFDAAFGRN